MSHYPRQGIPVCRNYATFKIFIPKYGSRLHYFIFDTTQLQVFSLPDCSVINIPVQTFIRKLFVNKIFTFHDISLLKPIFSCAVRRRVVI